ncbi:MAG TPA: ABC transporter permease subunit/CPBP intramembrane protease [Gemmataceae bacterium]|nr:ABC transporter permease subunit/CPBP intramembrane protease [Gemmataceae bacterium]
MRWSIIRLIWLRELRDQLRDRRTLFMIAGLPLLLYPVLGFAVLQFAVGFVEKASTVGVVRSDPSDEFPSRTHAALLGSFAIPPAGPAGAGVRPDYLASAAALASHPALNYPVLVKDGRFQLPEGDTVEGALAMKLLGGKFKVKYLDGKDANAALQRKEVDVLLQASPAFWYDLSREGNRRSWLEMDIRAGDDNSSQAMLRLNWILEQWRREFKSVHLQRQGLPGDFDEPFAVRNPQAAASAAALASDSMNKMIVRIFPFMLVMWSLAGGLYPAVDVCAGEKERGTMETLLISPAGREEIVWGKFLTIWVFSTATALLNLLSMGITTWLYGDRLPTGGVTPTALLGCVLLSLPLAAFFSAVCLAVGAYARSSKEGQYYLLPLFLITMPLIFLTLAPGVELNSFYSMVPVTGVVLLMQALMTPQTDPTAVWFYLLPVLAPILLYSWLALRWAIDLFQREEVLFREAERLEVGLWLRRLFREKEALPTAGQALFCFGLLLGLRWLSLGLGDRVELLVRHTIVLAAFVAAPPLFMALMLTRHPRQALSLHLPRAGYLLVALLLLPLAELAYHLVARFQGVLEVFKERHRLVSEAFGMPPGGDQVAWGGYVVLLAALSAVPKEIAFRGLILNGLRRRFRPWPAIVISSLLFAAFHMNVFALLPTFLLGVALGVLAVRSGSLLPGIVLHLGCDAIVLAGAQRGGELLLPGSAEGMLLAVRLPVVVVCTAGALAILWLLNRRGTSLGPLAALVSFPEPPASEDPR